MIKEPSSGYPIAHSTSVDKDANIPSNWSQEYTRKASISSGSYYPSSEAEIEIDDEDTWSEVFEEPEKAARITEYVDQTRPRITDYISDEEKEQTPLPEDCDYEEYGFVKGAGRPQPPVEKMWKSYGDPIVEKRPPAVAMARRSSTERGGATSRKSSTDRGPKKRSDIEDRLFREKVERAIQRTPQLQRRPASRAGMMTYEDSPPARHPQPPRPASRAAMMAYEDSPPRRPQPPRPASRAGTSYAAKETYFGQRDTSPTPSQDPFRLSRSPSITSTSTALSEAVSEASTVCSSTPPKAGGQKCPHCYIHSWLPHSPNCPKKK